MLSLGVRAAVATGWLALVLAGCGISDPYTTTQPSSSTVSSHGADVPDDDGLSPPRMIATPRAAAASPQVALARYAALYVNWTAASLSGDERRLVTLSTGQARAQALAESNHPAPAVARYAVSNSGSVVAIGEGRGVERGRWAVVTVEQTNGYGPYLGLPATSHVTWATVVRVAQGWIVSGWYPGS
jgi:hypothetical protein